MSNKTYGFPNNLNSEFVKAVSDFADAASGQRIKDRIKELEMGKSLKLWIARDIDGVIHLFIGNKPKKGSMYFRGDYSGYPLGIDVFPEITFENSPQQVELKLIEE